MGRHKVCAKINGPTPEALIRLAHQRSPHLYQNASQEPPTKRQRLQNGDSRALQGTIVEDFVTLVKIDIDLEFNKRECSTLPHGEPRNEFSVMVESIEKISNNEYHLRISDMEDNCVIDAMLVSETMGPVWEELQWSITVRRGAQRNNGRIRSNTPEIAKSQWFLILPQNSDFSTVRLQTLIKWRTQNTVSIESMSSSKVWSKLLSFVFPQGTPDTTDSWSPREFYRGVHVPNKNTIVPDQIQSDQLDCQLYSFQKRAVRWMLRREGVDIDSSGFISAYQCEGNARAPSLFYRSTDAEGRPCHVSHLLGIVSTEMIDMRSSAAGITGGILAEEMGLGKTVELISLICLHKRRLPSRGLIHDGYSNKHVVPSSATLIITPPSILQQWQSELATHAPSLKVLRYDGSKHDNLDNDAVIKLLLQHDIVLTTYNVLAGEIHYAGPTPDRQLRHQKKYIPRRSPLVQISWWRVCLDEAQMVESGVSNAATVARLIPRCNAWAVSGTPVRKDAKDLLGLLIFLRYEPFCDHPQLWNKLATSFKDSFRNVFGHIALRHTKEDVRDEIRLPLQTRVVITVPFTQIEEQHYTHLFQQMCADCGLDVDGSPLTESWDPDSSTVVEKMRGWLTRLRQTCLHPEVGIGNRRALGHGDGPLRTVSEVLEVMIEQNQFAIRTEQRSLLMSKIRRGQILENNKMSREALDIWLEALRESKTIVEECRAQLLVDPDGHEGAGGGSKVYGRDGLDEHEDDDESDGMGDRGKREPNSRPNARLRLRAALEVQHICTFFSANAYFQIKTYEEKTKPGSKEFIDLNEKEMVAYESAKQIRKEMLSEALGRVGRLMRRVEKKANLQSFVEIPEGKPSVQIGGIESRKILDGFEALVGTLNVQANQLDEWRENVVQFLLRPLVDEDEGIEIQGDEYETSTKEQDSLYVYMEALRAAVADRHDVLTGQSNFLIQEEMKVAANNAKNGKGPLPELLLNLLSVRSHLKPSQDIPSMRSLVADLRALSATLRWQEEEGSTRARAELAIAEKELSNFQGFLRDQMKTTANLEQSAPGSMFQHELH
ncbi:hypothetical protein GP486_000486 [Trichoglossum hirsutum]|uniref:Helicase ATP-binding domain-containing protein n=1 Tax=Trichoglossum hirsutum TaxID=265104 RepID=A0A9P8LHQ4_9PEZI|nr:hypothetical protein GP486_000486 [Trichoglossum hirsutum]